MKSGYNEQIMWRRLKDLVIPHQGNMYRPDVLEQFSVGVMLVLVLLSFAMANVHALLWISSDWLVSTILPSVIVDRTNEERDSVNVTPLKRSSVLDAAAKLKAEDMAKYEYFAHYSPSGVSPWYWFDQAGYNYLHAGENLAVHFTESNEVIDAWMDSPSHRANIMNGQYAEIGVGTAKGEFKGYPTIFIVQLFGTARAEVALGSVAGASTEVGRADITIEKVAVLSNETHVAPATLHTEIPAGIPVEEQIPLADASIESVVLVTNTGTTSREGVPAALTESSNVSEPLPLSLRTATESRIWLTSLYSLVAIVVVLSLLASIIWEWRRHHPVQIVYAGGLLTVMALLLYIHTSLTGNVVII